ncbi:MAG: hypothetical protein JW910_21660, partial [Anaerolineae bacterium]|nr:hypothetical protein [Anaerolineae bacterium]
MEDLAAFVLSIRATKPCVIRQHMGRAIQQFLLGVIQAANPQLSAFIHDQPHGPKPYTTSTLMSHDSTIPVHGNVAANTQLWLRIVGLQREVVAALYEFYSHSPSRMEIDRHPWSVDAIYLSNTDHPWAGTTTYMALLSDAMQAPPPRTLRMRFESPTSFHSN